MDFLFPILKIPTLMQYFSADKLQSGRKEELLVLWFVPLQLQKKNSVDWLEKEVQLSSDLREHAE